MRRVTKPVIMVSGPRRFFSRSVPGERRCIVRPRERRRLRPERSTAKDHADDGAPMATRRLTYRYRHSVTVRTSAAMTAYHGEMLARPCADSMASSTTSADVGVSPKPARDLDICVSSCASTAHADPPPRDTAWRAAASPRGTRRRLPGQLDPPMVGSWARGDPSHERRTADVVVSKLRPVMATPGLSVAGTSAT